MDTKHWRLCFITIEDTQRQGKYSISEFAAESVQCYYPEDPFDCRCRIHFRIPSLFPGFVLFSAKDPGIYVTTNSVYTLLPFVCTPLVNSPKGLKEVMTMMKKYLHIGHLNDNELSGVMALTLLSTRWKESSRATLLGQTVQ